MSVLLFPSFELSDWEMGFDKITFLPTLSFHTASAASKLPLRSWRRSVWGLTFAFRKVLDANGYNHSWFPARALEINFVIPANALCRPCTDVSKLFASVYLNFETISTEAGWKKDQSGSLWAMKVNANSAWGGLPVASFTQMVQGEMEAFILPSTKALKYKLNPWAFFLKNKTTPKNAVLYEMRSCKCLYELQCCIWWWVSAYLHAITAWHYLQALVPWGRYRRACLYRLTGPPPPACQGSWEKAPATVPNSVNSVSMQLVMLPEPLGGLHSWFVNADGIHWGLVTSTTAERAVLNLAWKCGSFS